MVEIHGSEAHSSTVEHISNKGMSGGYAELNSNSRVPPIQLGDAPPGTGQYFLSDTGVFDTALSNIGCRVYNSVNQAISNNISTALQFDSERYDTESEHSSLYPSRLTAITHDKRLIFGNIQFQNQASPVGVRQVSIKLNGVTTIASVRVPAGVNDRIMLNISTIWHMAAGDYVELMVFQNSGSSLNVEVSGSYSPEFGMTAIQI